MAEMCCLTKADARDMYINRKGEGWFGKKKNSIATSNTFSLSIYESRISFKLDDAESTHQHQQIHPVDTEGPLLRQIMSTNLQFLFIRSLFLSLFTSQIAPVPKSNPADSQSRFSRLFHHQLIFTDPRSLFF